MPLFATKLCEIVTKELGAFIWWIWGDWCNRTDQIIRAQVQKQAPKRSNFRT
jgi:hypothetical protein